jgi:mRNA-degrading endonuclease HigB of HigAB toxin-antitoxin module
MTCQPRLTSVIYPWVAYSVTQCLDAMPKKANGHHQPVEQSFGCPKPRWIIFQGWRVPSTQQPSVFLYFYQTVTRLERLVSITELISTRKQKPKVGERWENTTNKSESLKQCFPDRNFEIEHNNMRLHDVLLATFRCISTSAYCRHRIIYGKWILVKTKMDKITNARSHEHSYHGKARDMNRSFWTHNIGLNLRIATASAKCRVRLLRVE